MYTSLTSSDVGELRATITIYLARRTASTTAPDVTSMRAVTDETGGDHNATSEKDVQAHKTPETPGARGSAEDEEDEDEEDDEPKLKYNRFTGSLGSLYRNGDATSSFLMSGDKMVLNMSNFNVNDLH